MTDRAGDPMTAEPAAGQPLRRRDGRRTVWAVAGVGFAALLFAFSVQQWWVETGAGRYFAKPIPPGEYAQLETWETPTEDLGPGSRFLFAYTVDEDETTSQFWWGSPTEESAYLLNGVPVERDAFEQALSQHPPAGMSATVEVEGELSRLDAYVPAY